MHLQEDIKSQGMIFSFKTIHHTGNILSQPRVKFFTINRVEPFHDFMCLKREIKSYCDCYGAI